MKTGITGPPLAQAAVRAAWSVRRKSRLNQTSVGLLIEYILRN
jgi:hypothetical protein